MEGFAAASRSFEPRALLPGSRLGKYEIIQRLAVGGMAELYLAKVSGIQGFEKLLVIKRVHPHLASDAGFIRMFLNEARLAATLDHPNVTQVMDFGVVDGEHFFTMEYLHGEDLREILQHAAPKGGIPLECAVEVVLGVARGLHHAHERCSPDGRPLGIVHRDVSPSNVFVTYEGGVKVVDFGIAKAGALTVQTQAGTLKGKIGYMSPEQCRGESVDRRSDVFALGILLYETTTARRLFFAQSQYAILNKIIEGRYTPASQVQADYPAELEAIVDRALSVDPDERFGTAEAFQVALEDFAHEARLRCSPHVLARYVEGLLGHRPYPTSDIPIGQRVVRTGVTEVASSGSGATVPAIGEPVLGAGSEPAPSRRGLWAYGLVGALALLAGLGVGGVLRSEPAPAEPTSAPESASAPGSASAPVAVTEPETPVEGSSPGSSSGDAEPDDAESGDEVEPSTDPPSSRKGRRRKGRRKSKAVKSSGNKTLYPPSYYE